MVRTRTRAYHTHQSTGHLQHEGPRQILRNLLAGVPVAAHNVYTHLRGNNVQGNLARNVHNWLFAQNGGGADTASRIPTWIQQAFGGASIALPFVKEASSYFGGGGEGSDANMATNSNELTPMAAATTTGSGGGAAGGSSAGYGTVLQNIIGPSTGGSVTTKFRSCGTVFINDDAGHNTWLNVPWEFPRIWCRGKKVWDMYVRFTKWRTSAVKITLKNPIQRYQYQTGTQTLSQTDPNAKLIVWVNNSRSHGCPLHPGWTNTDWDNFNTAFSTGGFSKITNSAFQLPVTADLDTQPNNNRIDQDGIADFAPDTEMLACNVATSCHRIYIPSNSTWRSTAELAADFADVISTPDNMHGSTDPSVTAVDYPIFFRADNFSCRMYSPGGSLMTVPASDSSYNDYKYWTYLPFIHGAYGQKASSSNPYTFPGDRLSNYNPKIVLATEPTNIHSSPCLVWNECIEEHPQPQMWITYKNLLNVDGSSIMNQKISVDVEYEWEVEFSGEIIPNSGTGSSYHYNTLANISGIQNPQSYLARPHSFLDPGYLAVPIYNYQINMRGDEWGNNTSPHSSVKTPSGLLNTMHRLARLMD